MPRLANDRNDLYCRHRAKGMIPSKAAMAAGYAAGSSTTHLESDPDVVARIAELMDEQKQQREAQRTAAMEAARVVGQMTGVTRAWVIQKLAENAQLAANDSNFKDSNYALELIGKDFGMFDGGSGDDAKGGVPSTFDMDKLDGLLDSAHGALPAPAVDPDRTFAPEVALSLIEGQTNVRHKARTFSTGSETDVALTADALPDDPREADEPEPEPEIVDDFDAIRAGLDLDE